MKITETSPPPPKLITVEMTEAEANVIYWALSYYTAPIATAAAVVARAEKQFKQFEGKAKYPYTDCFLENV